MNPLTDPNRDADPQDPRDQLDPQEQLDPREHELLCAYMLGEYTPEECAEVERRLAEVPALAAERARLERTIGLVRQSFTGEEDVLSAESLARVRAAAARKLGAPRWRTPGLAAAAALFVLTGSYATWRVLFDPDNSPGTGPESSAELASASRDRREDRRRENAAPVAAESEPTSEFEGGETRANLEAARERDRFESATKKEAEVEVVDHLRELEQLGYQGVTPAAPAAPVTTPAAPTRLASADPPGTAKLARARGSSSGGLVEVEGESPPGSKLLPDTATLMGDWERQAERLDRDELLAGLAALGGDVALDGERGLDPVGAAGQPTAGLYFDEGGESYDWSLVGELDPALEGVLELGRQGVPLELALDSLKLGEDADEVGEALVLEEAESDLPGELAATGTPADTPTEALAGRRPVPDGEAAKDLRKQQPRADDDIGDLTNELEDTSAATHYRIDGDKLTDALLAECRLRPGESPSDMFYRFWGDNAWEATRLDALSTFGVDVDTNSYTLARAYLADGYLPVPEQIRTEEFVNYFDAGVAAPVDRAFDIDLELAPSPFGADPNDWLLRVVVSGKVVPLPERPPLQLTFVVDKSGSMREGNRLQLVQEGIRMLLSNLDERDSLAIVSFDESARLVLPMTTAANQATILESISGLVPDGSTNAAAGLRLGYAHAADNLRTDGSVNRVVLLSDGVANTGDTDKQEILDSVAKYKEQGIYLNTVGVGMDNHNDVLLEQLADDGDGIAAYVDDELEARKHLVEDFVQTTVPIARDAKIQVELDPGQVARYRLLGYENRAIADADFRNDAVDAGELNSGHQVTALYELERVSTGPDPLRPIAIARLRWKAPYESGAPEEVAELEASVGARDASGSFEGATLGFQRAALVAQQAELLRRSVHARDDSVEAFLAQARRLAATLRDTGQADLDFDELVALAERAGALLAAEAGQQGELWSALEAIRERAWKRAVLERDAPYGAESRVAEPVEVGAGLGEDFFLGGDPERAAREFDAETRALEERLRELIKQELGEE